MIFYLSVELYFYVQEDQNLSLYFKEFKYKIKLKETFVEQFCSTSVFVYKKISLLPIHHPFKNSISWVSMPVKN